MSMLTSRRFLPLFITQFIGAFCDNVFKNAFVLLAPSASPAPTAGTRRTRST
jgi:hypothetical protein